MSLANFIKNTLFSKIKYAFGIFNFASKLR